MKRPKRFEGSIVNSVNQLDYVVPRSYPDRDAIQPPIEAEQIVRETLCALKSGPMPDERPERHSVLAQISAILQCGPGDSVLADVI